MNVLISDNNFVVLAVAFVLISNFSLQGLEAARYKRLIGGSDAKGHEIYYQASLRSNGIHVCAGAIISEKHILTAAHCVEKLFDPPYDELSIVTGTMNLGKGGDLHQVFNISSHPNFMYGKDDSWFNDIAVITLKKEIKKNERQRAIQLPESSVPSNSDAVIIGWGRTSARNPYMSKDLKRAWVKTLSRTECQKLHKYPVREGQMCSAPSKSIGICKGDSGGPLTVHDTIIGIASWNIPPCASGKPDVYTNVVEYIDFIEEIIYPETN